MRQILLFAALAASLALLSGCALSKAKKDTEDMTDKAAYHKISAEEAYEMMASQEVVVVDVRTRKEYDGGHIENAVLVPSESIGSEMPEALPDKEATLLSLGTRTAFSICPPSYSSRVRTSTTTTSCEAIIS